MNLSVSAPLKLKISPHFNGSWKLKLWMFPGADSIFNVLVARSEGLLSIRWIASGMEEVEDTRVAF